MPNLLALYHGIRGHLPGMSGYIQSVLIVLAIHILVGRDIDSLTDVVKRQGERIELLEQRVYGSYERNGTMYKRRLCLAMRREKVPIMPGECDDIFEPLTTENPPNEHE